MLKSSLELKFGGKFARCSQSATKFLFFSPLPITQIAKYINLVLQTVLNRANQGYFMLFWKKKAVESVEPTLKEEVRQLKAKITRLDSEVLDLITAQEILRNKVLRKIQAKKDTESEQNNIDWGGIPLQ